MIRPININLNAAHPELKLLETVTYTGSPSSVFIRGIPPNYGRWAITAVFVAASFPDGSTTTRAAVRSADGVWVATLPATATSGRTENGFRVIADGIDENGEAVTGYIIAVADFAVASLDVTPAPEPGETSYQMLYFDEVPSTLRKGDVAKIDGVLKFYNGSAWEPFAAPVTLDNAVTRTSENGVKSSGIWSAIWGALSALPTGFSSLYDWCVSQLAGKMPSTATGADIAVSGTDATKINAALAGKLDKSGGTVTGDLVMSLTNTEKGLALTKNSALGNFDWRLFVDSSSRLAFYSLGDWYTATLRRRAGTIAFLDEIGITAFDATATYAVGAKVVYDNAVWNCTTAVSTAGAWSTVGSNFTKLFDLDTGAPASGGTKLITNGQAFTVLQGKADVSAIPYSLVTQPIVGNGVLLEDRASNAVTISTTLSPNTLTILFLPALIGKVRDFAMRLNIAAGVTAPEIAWPQGVTLENDGGEVPEIADGGTGGSSTILYFSETENNGTTAKFLVKGETLTAIAQA